MLKKVFVLAAIACGIISCSERAVNVAEPTKSSWYTSMLIGGPILGPILNESRVRMEPEGQFGCREPYSPKLDDFRNAAVIISVKIACLNRNSLNTVTKPEVALFKDAAKDDSGRIFGRLMVCSDNGKDLSKCNQPGKFLVLNDELYLNGAKGIPLNSNACDKNRKIKLITAELPKTELDCFVRTIKKLPL